jgi:hypothetical protein
MHALAKSTDHVPAFLAESQPLAWTSLLDKTRLSEMHLLVKLVDLGAGNNPIHVPSW